MLTRSTFGSDPYRSSIHKSPSNYMEGVNASIYILALDLSLYSDSAMWIMCLVDLVGMLRSQMRSRLRGCTSRWPRDWLIDLLTDWLTDWPTDWLIDWLIDWLADLDQFYGSGSILWILISFVDLEQFRGSGPVLRIWSCVELIICRTYLLWNWPYVELILRGIDPHRSAAATGCNLMFSSKIEATSEVNSKKH